MDDLKTLIREIPDFPKPGILFYDITTLLQDPRGLRQTIDRFVWLFSGRPVDKVLAIESRGFMFGPVLAHQLHAGFVPARKPGKLPGQTLSASYDLEYGSDTLEMHTDAVRSGERVLVVDDLIATGGTARAAARLVEKAGGTVAGFGFIVELTDLGGRGRLDGYPVESLIRY
jgi:adenine phosphoribosyltransferase